MNKEKQLTTENTAQEPIGWGIETTDGVTKPFPYFENSEVVGGENFWPTQDGAREGAAIANAQARAAEHPLREATISGFPIYSGTNHPEAFLTASIYAHALGSLLRHTMGPRMTEEQVAATLRSVVGDASRDIVRAHTSCGASSNCADSTSAIDDKQIVEAIDTARIVDDAAVPLFVGEPREDAAPLPILDPIYVELRVGEDGVPKLGSWARTGETYTGPQRMPNTTVVCVDRARRVRSENGCLVAYTDGEQKPTSEEVNEVFGVGGVNA